MLAIAKKEAVAASIAMEIIRKATALYTIFACLQRRHVCSCIMAAIMGLKIMFMSPVMKSRTSRFMPAWTFLRSFSDFLHEGIYVLFLESVEPFPQA